jgi:hypothetical protein
MGTTLYTCYRRIDFRRGDPKRLGILVPKATGGWPAPQMPTRDRRLQPQSKDNLESHNRQLGRNSLGLNRPSREIGGEITHLCMHGQHQTQSAVCALRAKASISASLSSFCRCSTLRSPSSEGTHVHDSNRAEQKTNRSWPDCFVASGGGPVRFDLCSNQPCR